MSDESFDVSGYPAATMAAQESVKNELEVPAGYIPVRLSSNGAYGAPALFHIKAFSPEDIINLSLSENEDLPIKTAQLLQSIIYEKNVNVLLFHKDLAIELLVTLVATFYNKKLEVPYTPTQEDYEDLKKIMKEEDFQTLVQGIKSGIRKYSYEIELDKVDYYKMPEGKPAPSKITIKKPGFEAKFTYPKYGDAIVLKRALDEQFGDRDKSFEKPYAIYKNYKELEARQLAGENIDLSKVGQLPKAELKKLKDYEREKLTYTIYLTKGLHLVELNGENMEDKTLLERAEAIAACSAFDHPTFENLSKKMNEAIQVGPIHKMTIKNPVTGKPKEIDYPFRELDLFAALKDVSSDAGGVTYEVE